MLSGNEKPYEVAALHKDGMTFPCEIQAKMTKYQGRSLRVTVLRDITEVKKVAAVLQVSEKKLKQWNKGLEERIKIKRVQSGLPDIRKHLPDPADSYEQILCIVRSK